MQATVLQATPRQRDVDGLRRQAGVQHRRLQRVLTRVQRILNFLFCLVDHRPGCRAIFRWHFTQGLHL
ncbi:hypothetical protein D3C77_676870 [compost metagenome]